MHIFKEESSQNFVGEWKETQYSAEVGSGTPLPHLTLKISAPNLKS